MGDEIQITVIATGIDKDHHHNVIRLREVTPEEAEDSWTVRVNGEGKETLDTPTFQRLKKEPEPVPFMEEEVPLNESKKSFFKRPFLKDNLDYPTFLRAKAD
jgi:hypothetical protein